MTQAELAEHLGTSQPVIARLERSGANPTWTTLIRALRATGHDLELKSARRPTARLDLGQLRERLAMAPGERLRSFQASQRSVQRLKAAASRRPRR